MIINAPAICYESLRMEHAENAMLYDADIYLASVAKSKDSLKKGDLHYPKVARRFSIPVLMSNAVGPCDDFVGAGGTSVWDSEGNKLACMGADETGILIYQTEYNAVMKSLLILP